MPAEVPGCFDIIFEYARQLLRRSDKIASNVTCMQPADEREHKWGGFELASLPLKRGRRCADGHCCDECSRVIMSSFARASQPRHLPQHRRLRRAFRDTRDVLHFVRLLERARRSSGLPLPTPRASRTTAEPLHRPEPTTILVRALLPPRREDRLGTRRVGESIEANGAEWPLSGEDGVERAASANRDHLLIWMENLHGSSPSPGARSPVRVTRARAVASISAPTTRRARPTCLLRT